MPRWISFYEQISAILSLSPGNILKIGLGSKIVYTILKELGFKITSLDNNIELNPDILGDVKMLEIYSIKINLTVYVVFKFWNTFHLMNSIL